MARRLRHCAVPIDGAEGFVADPLLVFLSSARAQQPGFLFGGHPADATQPCISRAHAYMCTRLKLSRAAGDL